MRMLALSPTVTAAAACAVLAAPAVAHAQAAASRPAAALSMPLEQLCGPRATLARPTPKLIIQAGPERAKTTYGPGETVIINAGTSQGLRAGQRYFVRRVIEDQFAARAVGVAQTFSIHTPGWITILEAQADAAVATISEACDGVLIGDYLEPFVLPSPAAPPAVSQPDFARPARILLGGERRQIGAEAVVMVIDRGSDHGLRIGQPLTIFRHTLEGRGPVVTMGDAVVIEVRPETSMIRINRSREAIEVGDLVAIHR